MPHQALERQEQKASFQIKPREIEMEKHVYRQPQSPMINHYRNIGNMAVQRMVGDHNPKQQAPDQRLTNTKNTNGPAQSFDFSNVRIHKDSASAVTLGALAYTRGNDIHFAPGHYNPNTVSGRKLITHELGHVVQQRRGDVTPSTQVNGLSVNDSPVLEKEADHLGADCSRQPPNSSYNELVNNTGNCYPIATKESDTILPRFNKNEEHVMQLKIRLDDSTLEEPNAASIEKVANHFDRAGFTLKSTYRVRKDILDKDTKEYDLAARPGLILDGVIEQKDKELDNKEKWIQIFYPEIKERANIGRQVIDDLKHVHDDILLINKKHQFDKKLSDPAEEYEKKIKRSMFKKLKGKLVAIRRDTKDYKNKSNVIGTNTFLQMASTQVIIFDEFTVILKKIDMIREAQRKTVETMNKSETKNETIIQMLQNLNEFLGVKGNVKPLFHATLPVTIPYQTIYGHAWDAVSITTNIGKVTDKMKKGIGETSTQVLGKAIGAVGVFNTIVGDIQLGYRFMTTKRTIEAMHEIDPEGEDPKVSYILSKLSTRNKRIKAQLIYSLLVIGAGITGIFTAGLPMAIVCAILGLGVYIWKIWRKYRKRKEAEAWAERLLQNDPTAREILVNIDKKYTDYVPKQDQYNILKDVYLQWLTRKREDMAQKIVGQASEKTISTGRNIARGIIRAFGLTHSQSDTRDKLKKAMSSW